VGASGEPTGKSVWARASNWAQQGCNPAKKKKLNNQKRFTIDQKLSARLGQNRGSLKKYEKVRLRVGEVELAGNDSELSQKLCLQGLSYNNRATKEMLAKLGFFPFSVYF
jgi:hypothetical protein